MDFKNVVYNAARDGKLRRLKVFLDHRPKDEIQMLVSAKTNGATPLVMACRNGHYEVAEYLIERCNADIEQPGSVIFDGETIEGAPPLWCAAAAGHLPVVRLLVRHGANVNSTTRTNSTPLRAACFDGHFDIVKFLIDHKADIEVANRHGHTCLMIACYKGHYRIAKYLIELNADVNRKSVKGNTALHDCAESGSLAILQLLLQHGAKMDVDSYGMTPLLAASVTGHNDIVEYLIGQPSLVSRKEKIDALELLGATYVDKKRNMIDALQLWKRAMEERYHDGLPAIPKPTRPSPIAAYEHAIEISQPEQLQELVTDPDEMRMQALLVRERILGPAHPDTSYYIRYRGAVYADAGKFDRCVTLWTYALDMQQRMLEPLSPMTQSSLLSFTELFSFMMSESRTRGRRVPPVNFSDVLSVFRKSINEVANGMVHLAKIPAGERDLTYFHRTLVIVMHLGCLLARLLPHLDQDQGYELRKASYELVKLQPRARNNATPLHLACMRDCTVVGRYPVCSFPAPELAGILLEVGADADARDADGNTPLHVAALARPCPSAVARTLLDHGAHIDLVNGEGKTFAQVLKGQEPHELINTIQYTSLQCLAARVIQKYNIPYKGAIPISLESFLAEH